MGPPASRPPRRAGWRTYLRRAILDPGHLVAFGGIFTLVVMIPDTWRPLTVLACAAIILGVDALVVFLASLSRTFRRTVDEDLAEAARAAAVARRAVFLSRMSEVHQQQLRELESLVDAMRACPLARAAPVQPLLDSCGDLLATFVDMAIRHRRSQACLDGVNRARLGDDIVALERAVAGSTGSAHAQAEERLALARRRAELWDSGHRRLAEMDQQLSMVIERIHQAHEDVHALHASDSTAHLRVAVPEQPELQAVRVDEDIDPAILELGRQAH